VSVVVSFWNAEPFLREAIDSVFAQTFDDWELLLVDDGSTDASRVTAEQAIARAPRKVRLLAHPGGANRGLPASRNLGMQHAQGDLIAFLDADDVWLPEKLVHQVAAFDEHPDAGFVYGPSEWWHSWTGHPKDAQRDHVPDLQVAANVPHPPPSLLPVFLRNAGLVPCPSSIVVRRSVAERVGFCDERFRGHLALYEDQAFYSKVAVAAPMLRLDRCVARYRQHNRQMTFARTAEHAKARRFYLEWLRERLLAAEQRNATVRRVVDSEYRELVPTPVTWIWRGVRLLLRVVERAARSVARRILPQPARAWLRARLRA
jgi:glycosyltransferase involved in cell wall biosynthesis